VRNQDAWRSLAETCRGADGHFLAQCADLKGVQLAFLRGLLAENAETKFGRAHGFAAIAGYADYAASVPISRYEAFAPYIEAAVAGTPGQLTGQAPHFVETTGGSTSGAKIIPYTQAGLDSYWHAIRAWLSDLMQRRNLHHGRIYFALSPVGRSGSERIGVLPLGSPKRFAYFGSAAPSLAEISVAPAELSALADFDAWCFATCLHLLGARDLTLIWVWSPTYLTELVRAMMRLKPALLEAIANGRPVPHEAVLSGVPLPAPNPARAAELEPLLSGDTIDARAIWPQLDTISCWMDASSAPFAAELRRLFPDAWFQAKGLMSTEGAITVPFGEGQGSPLALDSGFFEFVDGERVYPAWDLERGRTYRVLLSNRFGLYRYDMADLVEVVGFTGQTPRLVFKGRLGLATDLCGEKLTEEFVLSCMQAACDGPPIFAILAPSSGPHPHYVLYANREVDNVRIAQFAERLELQLRRNPQYAYARHLGQLSPLEIRVVGRLFERYREWAISSGRSIAGLKAPALLPALPAGLQAALNAEG
jgi:hypothetical protein